MSEEVGKALQSVVERLNQAAARRPKVSTTPGESSTEWTRCCFCCCCCCHLGTRLRAGKKWLIFTTARPPPAPNQLCKTEPNTSTFGFETFGLLGSTFVTRCAEGEKWLLLQPSSKMDLFNNSAITTRGNSCILFLFIFFYPPCGMF